MKNVTGVTTRIGPEIINRFSKLVRAEGETPARTLKELILAYTKERETRAYIDDLWGRIGGRLRSKGLRHRGIDRAIKEARKRQGKGYDR